MASRGLLSAQSTGAESGDGMDSERVEAGEGLWLGVSVASCRQASPRN
jgi:hypothetical protein